MLLSLHVKNLAVIREEEVLFGPGLNILTGETGAGKSILLGSVELFLNGKSDKSLVRKGEDFALCELLFSVEEKKILDALAALEIVPEEGIVTLSKKMVSEGRSISRINGETVPAAKLKEVASLLLDLHGQQDSQSLRQTKVQESILDSYIGQEAFTARTEIAKLYREYRSADKELSAATLDEAEQKKQISLLSFEIDEIEKASLVDGEDESLEEEFLKLSNGRKIIKHTGNALEYLRQDGAALDLLGNTLREINAVSEFDKDLSEIQTSLLEAESIVSDAVHSLSRYNDDFSFSEERFDKVSHRLNTMNRLKERYGRTIADIVKYKEEREAELAKLLDYETYITSLQETCRKKYAALTRKAKHLSGLRKKAAVAFREEVLRELSDLNFLSVDFAVDFGEKEAMEDGIDIITFLISLNPGEDKKALSGVASGGELSRIMLAIKTVLSDRDEIPTIIFDEIDAGISGRAAQKVAEKLSLIAEHRQVICITHLAQIAALSDHHFRISKEIDDGHASTNVSELSEEESILELARILGGKEITDAVLANAREMKKRRNPA